MSIYCDGSSHDVPDRPGGWAFVVVRGDAVLLQDSGAQPSASNNTMELTAALKGLNAVIERSWHVDTVVELVSDSRGALDIANGTAALPAHDTELANNLREACATARARTRWVRGHCGDRWNEYVDALAGAAKQTLVPARAKKKAERRRMRTKLRR